jgi:hypothetical protein
VRLPDMLEETDNVLDKVVSTDVDQGSVIHFAFRFLALELIQ